MAIDKAVDSTVLDGYFSDIADAIRDKDGTQNTYTPAQMPTAIENIPSGSSHDWSALGYSSEPQSIGDAYDYSVQIKNNYVPSTTLYQYWRGDLKITFFPSIDTSNVTNMQGTFYNCYSLLQVALFDTSKVTTMNTTFMFCYALKEVPAFDTSSVTNFTNTFSNCRALTDNSLNNILKMCINATSFEGTKKLTTLGISSNYYSASRIQGLSNYQDFVDAGWEIGY